MNDKVWIISLYNPTIVCERQGTLFSTLNGKFFWDGHTTLVRNSDNTDFFFSKKEALKFALGNVEYHLAEWKEYAQTLKNKLGEKKE